MRLHPFRALHPAPGRATEVASPPYDVVSSAEARALVQGRPWSFLRVVRPEVALPDGTSLYDASVYAAGAAALRRMIDEDVLVRDEEPAIWLYRLDWRGQAQIGFVGCAEVDDYAAGRIKRHELTRKAKEDDRARHVDTLSAHTGPVFLTCRDAGGLAALQTELTSGAPDQEVEAAGGVRHRLWRIAGAPALAAIAGAFAPVQAFYIADGHHRAASAWRTRDLRRQRDGAAGAAERFLAVVFPHEQLRILPYNRVVADLSEHDVDSFLARIGQAFEVGPIGADPEPTDRHTFAMYLDGQWRLLRARPAVIDESDPIARLDVAILQDHLLAPVLGIDDPRTSERIDFVGGIRGIDELARRVDAAGQGVAFAMHPTAIEELLSVADAGQVMPPKSTWFEPKLASGLLVNLIDD